MQIFSKLVVLGSWGLAFGFMVTNPAIAQPQPMVEVEPELSAAILRMEMNLEQEYEQYFDRDFSQVEQTPAMMAQKLDYLLQMTGKKHAVMWVMPKEDHLHLVLITPGQTPVVKDLYDVPESKLRDTLQAFRNNITNPRRKINLYASQQLYQWIVSPFEEEIFETENIDSLIFCLGNGLRGLPIAALYDGEQYLVENIASPSFLDLI
ncbi:MAG: CHAT domain-containing protein [Synechococcaceae cyanobacterium RL_1_2]|nr:CHAT domain-containing protein [Synechococcaceae cyanobacterium RL_1_2]